jgi:hypothetical protein
VQDELAALHDTLGERGICDIPFQELDVRDVREVRALTRTQIVGHADTMAAPDELFT